MNKNSFVPVIRKHIVVIILVVFWAVMFIFNKSFRTIDNISSILREASSTGIAALGMTFIIIMGDIDLSIGSMLALLGMILASTMEAIGLTGAILLTIVCGIACGLLNGALISYCKVPAFIATLGTYYAFRAVAYIYKDAGTYIVTNPSLLNIGNKNILKIPIPFIIMLVLSIAAAIVLNRTIFGRHIKALGNSIKAAVVSGINTSFVKMLTFGMIGLCTAVSTVIVTARQACASPDIATNFHFDAITMVVLGGTKMRGGEGSIFNTIIASILYASVANCLVLYHVGAQWQRICMGAILLLAFSFDFIQEAISQSKKKPLLASNKAE